MRGKLAKRLRKEAKYVKSVGSELAGDYNLTVGSGESRRVVNVKRFIPKEITEEEKEKKEIYKDLKKSYKS